MIYFDSDVLVHYFIEQDLEKNQQSIDLYQKATENELFFCSLLSLQETSYVLSRLKVQPVIIEEMIQSIFSLKTVSYNASHFRRAIELANKIGFQNISDCLHTAIAETYCTEIYTFNKADFKRLQNHTELKITIL